jgi:hypothetical protein
MITVIIEGTKNIERTLTSLVANSDGNFRVFVHEAIRDKLSKQFNIEFVKPSLLRKYGKKSDLYWKLPSGCLILTAAWDTRMKLCMKKDVGKYCLHPSFRQEHFATNVPRNIDKWKGNKYPVPLLSVTEG